MARIPAEVRYSPEGWEMRLGDVVWTRKLSWGTARGAAIRERWGHYSGYVGKPSQLRLRHANHAYRCTTCNGIIHVDEMHGSGFYEHHCLACITPRQPEEEFRTTHETTEREGKQ